MTADAVLAGRAQITPGVKGMASMERQQMNTVYEKERNDENTGESRQIVYRKERGPDLILGLSQPQISKKGAM